MADHFGERGDTQHIYSHQSGSNAINNTEKGHLGGNGIKKVPYRQENGLRKKKLMRID